MSINVTDFIHALDDSVRALDRERAAELCGELIIELKNESLEIIAEDMGKVLKSLRRKRFFWLLERVAEEYLLKVECGKEPPDIQLQLIQALIDQGKLMEAEDELLNIVDLYPMAVSVGSEIRGLLGRIHKQAFVNSRKIGTQSRTRRLRKAVNSYLPVYQNSPSNNWWHGINVVACLARAERDGIEISDLVDGNIVWKDMAREILQTVKSIDRDSCDFTWATATAMEACIALGNNEEANKWCERYITAPYSDVFELGSTERQLREVWELVEKDLPGAEVLRIIQGRLGILGGALDFSENPRSLMPTGELKYQATLGSESAVSVRWINTLCTRAYSIAKITKEADDGTAGTGFFVQGSDVNKSWDKRLVLVTNAHVLTEDGEGSAIRRKNARVHLTRALPSVLLKVQDVLWSDKSLDTTICAVDLPENESLKNVGLPVGRGKDLKYQDSKSKPRLYVIGHPSGEDLRISLFDNHLIDIDEKKNKIRYRCPTEEGSSGSPVLSSDDLEVVAIHHATRTDMQANQGILLDAVRSNL
jgi:V8-like Glu-specific endopeptidase